MERLKQLLPKIEQFAKPEKLLLVDFWSTAEQARGIDNETTSQLPELIFESRDNVEHLPVECTEDAIFQLPHKLLQNDADGVALLPPLAFDRGTREVLSNLLTRQQVLRQQSVPLLEQSAEGAENWWSDMPWSLMKQRDLSAFVVGMVIQCLGNNSTLNVLVPKSFLGGGRTSRLRETLQRDAKLRLVLELGSGLAGFHRNFESAWLALEITEEDDSVVRCFKLPTDDVERFDSVLADLQRLQKQNGGNTNYGYVLRNGVPAGGSWLVEAHHPRWEKYLEELKAVGEITTLDELGEINRGPIGGRAFTTEPNDYPLLHPRQLMPDGSIELEDVENGRYLSEEQDARDFLIETDDVLIREIHAFSDRQSPIRACLFPEVKSKLYMSGHLTRFRFSPNVDPDVRQFVVAYLRSTEAAQWLASRGADVRIQHQHLRALPVPVPNADILNSFKHMRSTKRQFAEWAAQLADIEERLFKYETLREAQREMMEVGSRAQQRIAAAFAADTLSWRVRNLYPHPLAFRFRTVETMENNLEKYLELFRAAEVAIAYAAIVSCAMSEAIDGNPPNYVSELASKLRDRPGTGVALGDWVAILDEVNDSRRYREIHDGSPFAEITKIYERFEGTKDTITSLSLKRNDMAHDRGPGDHELEKAIVTTSGEVESLFEALDCLSRYQLRFITSVRPAGRRKSGSYSYRELVGDHPISATKTEMFEGDVPAVGLHMVDQNGNPQFVEPWIVRRRCKQCQHEETYVLDRYLKDKSISLKSLEYGHEADGNFIREELGVLGIDLPK